MNEDSMKELERLRKQISQQEKMASLGLLSAGIAHEIQNPLNFVINFSKLSCKLLQDMEDVLDELESKLSAEPAASAVGFVVKNGSNILALMLSSMPMPLSRMQRKIVPFSLFSTCMLMIGVKSFFCNFFSNA